MAPPHVLMEGSGPEMALAFARYAVGISAVPAGIMVPCDLGLTDLAARTAKAGALRIASQCTASTVIPFDIMGARAKGGMTCDDVQPVPAARFAAGMEARGDGLGVGLVDVALVSRNAGAGQPAAGKRRDRGGLCRVSLDDRADGVAGLESFKPGANVAARPPSDTCHGLGT